MRRDCAQPGVYRVPEHAAARQRRCGHHAGGCWHGPDRPRGGASRAGLSDDHAVRGAVADWGCQFSRQAQC